MADDRFEEEGTPSAEEYRVYLDRRVTEIENMINNHICYLHGKAGYQEHFSSLVTKTKIRYLMAMQTQITYDENRTRVRLIDTIQSYKKLDVPSIYPPRGTRRFLEVSRHVNRHQHEFQLN